MAQEKQASSFLVFGHLPHVTHSRLITAHQAEGLAFTTAMADGARLAHRWTKEVAPQAGRVGKREWAVSPAARTS